MGLIWRWDNTWIFSSTTYLLERDVAVGEDGYSEDDG